MSRQVEYLGEDDLVIDPAKPPPRLGYNGPVPQFTAKITKLDAERQVAYGWASVIEDHGRPVEDAQGDVIKEATLVTAAHEFVTETRAAKVMHGGRRSGEIVESVVFTQDLQKALGIDLGKVGWFIGMKVRDASIWKRVLAGELPAFSVGGVGSRHPIS